MYIPSSENQAVPIENINLHLKEPYLKEFFSLWPNKCRSQLANMIMILGVGQALQIDSQTQSDRLYQAIMRKTNRILSEFQPISPSDLDSKNINELYQENYRDAQNDIINNNINNYHSLSRRGENHNVDGKSNKNEKLTGELKEIRNEVEKINHQIMKSHEQFQYRQHQPSEQQNFLAESDNHEKRGDNRSKNDYDLRAIQSQENERFLNFQKPQNYYQNQYKGQFSNEEQTSPLQKDHRGHSHNNEITPKITESPPPHINLKFSGINNIHVSKHHLDDREIKGVLSDNLSSPFYSKTRDSSPLNYYPSTFANSQSAKSNQTHSNSQQNNLNNYNSQSSHYLNYNPNSFNPSGNPNHHPRQFSNNNLKNSYNLHENSTGNKARNAPFKFQQQSNLHQSQHHHIGSQGNEKKMYRSKSQGRAVKDTNKNAKAPLPNYLKNVESKIRPDIMYHKFLKQKGRTNEASHRNAQHPPQINDNTKERVGNGVSGGQPSGGFEPFIHIREMNLSAAPRRRFIEEQEEAPNLASANSRRQRGMQQNKSAVHQSGILPAATQISGVYDPPTGDQIVPSQYYQGNQRKQVENNSHWNKGTMGELGSQKPQNKTYLEQQQARYSDFEPLGAHNQQQQLYDQGLRDRYLSHSESAQVNLKQQVGESDRNYLGYDGEQLNLGEVNNGPSQQYLGVREGTRETQKNYSIHSQNSLNILDIANNFLTSPLMNHFGANYGPVKNSQNPSRPGGAQQFSNNSNLTNGTGHFGEGGIGLDEGQIPQPLQYKGQSSRYQNNEQYNVVSGGRNFNKGKSEGNRALGSGGNRMGDDNIKRSNVMQSNSDLSSQNDFSQTNNHNNYINIHNKTGSSQSGDFDNQVQMILREDGSFNKKNSKQNQRNFDQQDLRSGSSDKSEFTPPQEEIKKFFQNQFYF